MKFFESKNLILRKVDVPDKF